MDGMEIIRKWQKLCQPSGHQTGRGNMWHSDGDEAPRRAETTTCLCDRCKVWTSQLEWMRSAERGSNLRISIRLKNEEHLMKEFEEIKFKEPQKDRFFRSL